MRDADDFNSYVDHLRKVFQIVREKHYQCQSKKLKVISKTDQLFRWYNQGWKVDTSNIKVVTDLVTNGPSNIGQQREVFGLLGYYRRYVKSFSRIAQPIFDLLEKDNIKSSSKVFKASTSIHWRRQFQKALETLIIAVTSPQLLSYPGFDQSLVLHVDAPTKGLGAGLYQYNYKKVRIPGCGNRASAKAEQKYYSS